MKWYENGDQLVVTYDDFKNLQESPAVFVDGGSEAARLVRKDGRVIAMPIGDLIAVRAILKNGGGVLI